MSLCGPFDDNVKQLERRLGIEINRRDNVFKLSGRPLCVNAAADILKTLYVDTNAQTTLKLFYIIVERPTQAHQTTVISRFKGDFTSFDIQTNPLGHSGPVMGCV